MKTPTPPTARELVDAERDDQRARWDDTHDDEYAAFELSAAAEAYRSHRAGQPRPARWPWHERFWKPRGRLENLVRAGALFQAEADRIGRLLDELRASRCYEAFPQIAETLRTLQDKARADRAAVEALIDFRLECRLEAGSDEVADGLTLDELEGLRRTPGLECVMLSPEAMRRAMELASAAPGNAFQFKQNKQGHPILLYHHLFIVGRSPR